MSITIPTPPTVVAGNVVRAADIQALTACVNFALTPPYCYVYNTAGGNANATVWTPVGYQAEDSDAFGMHNPTTNNGKITPNITSACRLEICSFARILGHDSSNAFPASTAHFRCHINVRANANGSQTGGTSVMTEQFAPPPAGVQWGDTTVRAHSVVDYTPGDSYETWVMQDSGLNLVIDTGVAVTGFWLKFAST